MKKLIVVASVGMLLFAASCKKGYSCTYENNVKADTVKTFTKLGWSDAKAQKELCELGEGTWAEN